MSPLTAPVFSGVVALVVTLVTGYFILHNQSSLLRRPWINALPLLAGLICGVVSLAMFIKTYLPDRFYSAEEAVRILAAMTAACILLWSVEFLVPRSRSLNRAAAHLLAQLLAAGCIVWAGVRFELLKVPGEGVTQLGPWSGVLTAVWLVTATNVVRLLDGIHGAAGIAVVIAGLTGLYSNIIYKEYFLTGFSLVAVGCVAGSLRFSMSDKRLPLEGSGTAIIGFLFATLTVLARQKTVATLLLLLPVVLIVLIAGAAMLGFLEKRLLLSPGSTSNGNREEPPGKQQ